MPNDPAYIGSKSVMGDDDRKEFHFNEPLTVDELTELLERNCRVSMLCDWMVGEALKNGWEWDEDEELEYTDPVTQETISISKDDYLELIKADEKIHRGLMFARLHGVSLAVMLNENGDLTNLSEDGTYDDFEIYHRTDGLRTGFKILQEDCDANGVPIQFSIFKYPAFEDGITKKDIKQPTPIKVNAKRCVVIKNPKKGERWGGTPSSKQIAHVAQLEELILKLMGKHILNIIDAFFHVKGCKSEDQADAIHDELAKKPIDEFFADGIELLPMRCEVQGSASDFDVSFEILKDYMACGMRVSRQAMDGAPEGTLSSAEYNTIISYSVIEQIQNHFKPYIEEIFAKLGFQNPNFDWVKPMLETKDNNGDPNAEGQGSVRTQA